MPVIILANRALTRAFCGLFIGRMTGDYCWWDVNPNEFCVLPDRNLVTRIVKLQRGIIASDANDRLAAGVITYAQHMNLLIEPSIAFHELAQRQGNETTREELAYFRMANNQQGWLDIAEGTSDRIILDKSFPAIDVLDFSQPLHRWNRNYVIALKIAEIELKYDDPVKKMEHLLSWMDRDFIIGGPAILFALLYFSPGYKRKGMLKQLRSNDRARAIKGIKNATWDLTYASDFARRVNESEDTHYIFASLDGDLRQIVKMVGMHLVYDSGILGMLKGWWLDQQAENIYALVKDCTSKISRDLRHVHAQRSGIDEFIEAGESTILSYKPAQ